MNTREVAYSIIDRLSEEELEKFIAQFRTSSRTEADDDLKERRGSFERLQKLCRYIPDLDENKELAEYREEKYGK